MGNRDDDRGRGQGWRDRDSGWSGEHASRGGGYGGRQWNGGERGEWRGGGDRDYGRGSGGGGRGDDRGFFERAGEEVRSWFGGDDDDRGRYGGGGGSRDYGNDWGSGGGGGGGGSGVFGVEGGSSRGGGTSGFGGGSDPGRRFDRIDPGHVGGQGAHPMSSPVGGAYGSGYGAGGGGGSNYARYAAMMRDGGQQHHLDTAKLLGDEPRGGHQQHQQGWQQGGGQGHGGQGFGGQGYGGGYGGGGFGGGSQGHHDPHYSQWRQRQVESLDRDYEEYRREHQSRFEQEFGSWREKRQGQRQSLGRVSEHMKVVGSDGAQVGTVDKVSGERIILTKSDENAGGRHHWIPCSWVDGVDEEVRLNIPSEQALRQWNDAEQSGAFFEGDPNRRIEDQGGGGAHMLDRSFSGTYKDGDR